MILRKRNNLPAADASQLPILRANLIAAGDKNRSQDITSCSNGSVKKKKNEPCMTSSPLKNYLGNLEDVRA